MSDTISEKLSAAVYYFAPDYDVPSWGVGLIYRHVDLLRKNGIPSAVLHLKSPFRCTWFESDTPIVYLDDPSFTIKKEDILVVPEVNASDKIPTGIDCRKIVFVQGAFIILMRIKETVDFAELGYERAIVTMPHIKEIVERHFGTGAAVITPTVAPYFFIHRSGLAGKERKKNIVLFPKPGYEKLGFVDYDILTKLLRRKFLGGRKNFLKRLGSRGGGGVSDWRIVELKGKTHKQVAEIMKDSAFFVNVNTMEGFNVTVAEAMAAGCIPVCYEAYGGKDYLKDGKNAYVFPNNYIYPLVDKLFSLVDTYADIQGELSGIRAYAYETASRYREEAAEEALLQFYRPLLD